MPLPLHLFIHFSLAILSGYLIGRYFKQIKLGIIIGFIGGFLIDLDHVLEYFLVFGPHFNIVYFFQGRQFLISNKIHLWFHAWEYVPVLLVMGLIFKKDKIMETMLLTLAFAVSVHLLTDSLINNYPLRFYSLFNRATVNFTAESLLSSSQLELNLKHKQGLGL